MAILLAMGCTVSTTQTENAAVLDLHRVLGSGYACAVPRPIQFLAEDELVVLAGPTPKCFENVSELELVAISLKGKVVARRSWTSTDSGLVVVPERLALPETGSVEILDTSLKTIQSLHVSRSRDLPALAVFDTGILSVSLKGQTSFYSGTPLRKVPAPPVRQASGTSRVVSTLGGSWELLREGDALIEARMGAAPRTFADLSWVIPPCRQHGMCEADDTTTRYQTVIGPRKRVLVTSTGAHVPVQGSFGILPYFRAQVFDLDTGAEVYREEDVFRARDRVAVLSPDGDVLVVSDGYTAVVHRLP